MDTRRCCTACRLAKCFSVGMSSDLIRKEEKKDKQYSSSFKFSINNRSMYNQAMVTTRNYENHFTFYSYLLVYSIRLHSLRLRVVMFY